MSLPAPKCTVFKSSKELTFHQMKNSYWEEQLLESLENIFLQRFTTFYMIDWVGTK